MRILKVIERVDRLDQRWRAIIVHLRDWLTGFTTGSMHSRSFSTFDISCARIIFAEALRSRFIPLEDLRGGDQEICIMRSGGHCPHRSIVPYVSADREQIDRISWRELLAG